MWMSSAKRVLFICVSALIIGAPLNALALMLERHQEGFPEALKGFGKSSSQTTAGPVAPVIAGTLTTLTSELPSDWARFDSPSGIVQELYLPLASRRVDGIRAPMLAAQWVDDTEHNKLIIELQDSAVWSDGIPITSKDISYTLFSLSNPASQTPFQRRLIEQYITKISEYDATHFALHYPERFESAPDFLLNLRAMPAHVAGAPADLRPPVSGPYKPLKLDESELILERQRDWWGDRVPAFTNRFMLRRIVYRPANDAAFTDFMQGQVDCISTIARTPAPNHWVSMLNRDQKITFISSQSEHPPTVSLLTSQRVSNEEHDYLQRKLSDLASPKSSHSSELADTVRSRAEIVSSPGPTLAWLTEAKPTTMEPAEVLRSRIRTGFFEAAVVVLPASGEKEILNAMTITNERTRVAPLYNIPYYQYACWAWVTLPEPGIRGGDIISPLDINDGGFIGIDRRHKARVLGRPERPEDEAPVVIRYPAQ